MQIGMERLSRTCAFTGHRAAKLPWNFRENDPRCLRLKEAIFDTVEAVYHGGVRQFVCGMANGCDLYFCEAVLRLREEYPDITLEAAIPFAHQAESWPQAEQERYQRLLLACDKRTLLQQEYT
ncbi:MAG: SLOG family protein, partial [Eubacteriales bacterium]|nr:SLOG family protein [Eubacteriales bacterium]